MKQGLVQRNLSPNSTLLPLALSVLFGLVTLGLAPFSIRFGFGDIAIDITWQLLFPIVIALAFGKKYALICALSGASWFPFLLWQNNGWANVLNFSLLTLLYYSLASTAPRYTSLRGRNIYHRLIKVFLWFLPLRAFGYLLLFPVLLSMNPVFWASDAMTSIPLQLRVYFVIKDSLSIVFMTVVAETVLRLPALRKLFGKRTPAAMRQNNLLFMISVSGALLVWLSLFLLDKLLVSDEGLLTRPYLSVALLLMLVFGAFSARALISFSEKMHITNAALRGSQQRLNASVQERNILIKELYHRTKNNLQTISSLISLRLAESDNQELHDVYHDIQNQIQAMSLIHTKLYQSGNLSQLKILSFLQEMFGLVSAGFSQRSNVNFSVEGDDLALPLREAIPCGIIITELLTNSFKHAFSNRDSGQIHVRIARMDDQTVCLSYSDNGSGVPDVEYLHKHGGVGTATVFAIAEGQLRGRVEIDLSNGLGYHIYCSL